MTTKLEVIKGLKRGNRNIFTPEDLALIEQFENLGDGYMEQKSITRLEKLLDRAVTEFTKQAGAEKIGYMSNLRGSKESCLWYKMMVSETYEYSLYKRFEDVSGGDLEALNKQIEVYNMFNEVVDRFFFVKSKRWMRNGKIPKSLQTETEKPEDIIKGKVDQKFINIIVEAGKEAKKVKEDSLIGMINKGIVIKGITHMGDGTKLSEAQIKKNVEMICSEFSSFVIFKLADKLGGIKTDLDVVKSSFNISAHKSYQLYISFSNNETLSLVGRVIQNTSPKGTPFWQMPATMTLGNLIGENNVKKHLGV